jgi:hypothetical protein
LCGQKNKLNLSKNKGTKMKIKSNNTINNFYENHIEVKSRKERAAIRTQLMKDLGLKTKQSFYNHKNGKVDMTISQGKVWAKTFGCTLNDLFV